ncbi:LOG family protein [Sinimarinibacterium sp. CAU 1509]|uniref:nucleotide 5'-monophosphate nucleosidase PpnN n=1 Tax=Sinimarinibacterium sp. CAU 1509 TaxID=2562283 RepID=UPI0010ABB28F|nr:nucleotide 5'-monophosphate nucleosidase PpnN [Sinimarinibacterium sp. CAU 1509]TJY59766.1 LOG family protein [Sinimarinibacterium sp. CAU 1509]
MSYQVVDAVISPEGSLAVLSRSEAAKLLDASHGGLYHLFRQCALAVLNCGSPIDDGRELLQRYPDFEIRVVPEERGIKLALRSAPAEAFVDGKMIRGISEHLFSVLRDLLFVGNDVLNNPNFDLDSADGTTDAVFHILRNAGVLRQNLEPRLVVCWGGHSISRHEYDYSKVVGYQLGLRGIDIGTGCGPGAMKGPMKGAAVAHAKQRIVGGQYLGITEPGIIAAEAPNPIVNSLVILPDIEKRLEAFVRTAHGIVVLPGGAGTAEEILYLLGILLHPDNAGLPFPLIFTGPASAAEYFRQIDAFIGATLGEPARQLYQIIVDDPARVAREMHAGIQRVRDFRAEHDDAFYFNWLLKIAPAFQRPFVPTHDAMRALDLHRDQAPHELAGHLRRAFSGIVAGNVKADGIREVEAKGPFELDGDADILDPLDALLTAFVAQQRMKLPGTQYVPCYRIVR